MIGVTAHFLGLAVILAAVLGYLFHPLPTRHLRQETDSQVRLLQYGLKRKDLGIGSVFNG